MKSFAKLLSWIAALALLAFAWYMEIYIAVTGPIGALLLAQAEVNKRHLGRAIVVHAVGFATVVFTAMMLENGIKYAITTIIKIHYLILCLVVGYIWVLMRLRVDELHARLTSKSK